MDFLEKDLEEIIFNAKISDLEERGLRMELQRKKQFRIGNYGIADIVGFERPYYHTHFSNHCKGTITVYELKKDKVNVSTFLQAVKYLKGIQSYLDKQKKYAFDSSYFNYKIVLIGKSIDKESSMIFLPEIINKTFIEESDVIGCDPILNLEIYTYSYHIDGLQFNEVKNYVLSNEGF